MTEKDFTKVALKLEDVYDTGIIVQINAGYGPDEYDTEVYGGYDSLIESIECEHNIQYAKVTGFYCPECGEPVYYNDWFDDFDGDCCPVCGYEFELD